MNNLKNAVGIPVLKGGEDVNVYVSSHSGCNQACRFCHLTATKQVGMSPAALDDLLTQVDAVFGYYDQQIRTGSQPPAQRVNINWMARGEPLLNDTLVVNGGKELLDALCDQIVTAVGVAHMFGMNIEGAMDEVNRSNFSKFVDGKPVFNEHGKIIKGPNYTPPDLTGFY